ncbi:DUF6173 family protein [Pelosinus sp. sgz500959]|uniref:DUF6173 family protein n=1 Tax=Pelosinus sp. sgz500959 TaxID=3242472 RepID=UPI00366A6B0A
MIMNPLEGITANIPMSRAKSFVEQMTEINQPYTAKNIFNELIQRIQKFEFELNEEHEVGMQLVSFGESTQFSVLRLGYTDPSIIWFEGVLPDGSHVELIQHVTQISFLMVALKRQDPEKPKAPIGFFLPS